MLDALKSVKLRPTTTVETTVAAMLGEEKKEETPKTAWVKTDSGWVEKPVEANGRGASGEKEMSCAVHEMHGQCFGFERERNGWAAPRTMFVSEHAARPGYDTLSASEYHDTPEVLEAKVAQLARLLQTASCCCVYAGAGLSTSAGIADYASAAGARDNDEEEQATGRGRRSFAPVSPLCAQPTLFEEDRMAP